MKKKLSKTDSYWQVLGAFVFECETYSEMIDKLNYYNANQPYLKKIPMSSSADNVCLIRFANRLLAATPKNMPKTQYEYLERLTKEMYKFNVWLQDNFRFFMCEGKIEHILSRTKEVIPKRFREIAPEFAYVEEAGNICVCLYGSKGEVYNQSIAKLKEFKENYPDDFNKLQCFLFEGTPRELPDSVDASVELAYKEKQHNAYSFQWEGKNVAKIWSEIESHDTLKPDVESSVNFDTTQNLYIEGDNLRALKALLPAYEGKVKMIYIDPPYNTGNNFVYKDNFKAENEIFDRFLYRARAKWQNN